MVLFCFVFTPEMRATLQGSYPLFCMWWAHVNRYINTLLVDLTLLVLTGCYHLFSWDWSLLEVLYQRTIPFNINFISSIKWDFKSVLEDSSLQFRAGNKSLCPLQSVLKVTGRMPNGLNGFCIRAFMKCSTFSTYAYSRWFR